jgi:type II secretory pathway pseudopilin PulG
MADRQSEAGFTYIALMITLAVIGVAAAATLQLGSVMQRRDAEETLLDIGGEFRAALKAYSQGGSGAAPQSLQDLVRDPRFPNPQRYLRKIYADPLTGKTSWGLVRTPNGNGIIGIFSLASGHPIKVDNFPAVYQLFKDKQSYADWIFTAVPVTPLQPTVTQPGTLPGTLPGTQPAPLPTSQQSAQSSSDPLNK